jgi:hypothetical protein
MSRRPPGAFPLLALSILLVLAAAESASAHPESTLSVQSSALVTTPKSLTSSVPGLTHEPEPQAMAWALGVGLLAVAAVAWRRRRALVGSGLIVLLLVFAFEQALHSVHHGLDPGEAERCAIAAASAHMAGTTVDPVTTMDVTAPPAEERSPEPEPARPAVPYPCPVQQRAPPA